MTEHRVSLGTTDCADCKRTVIESGSHYVIESCWNNELEPEAARYLDTLKNVKVTLEGGKTSLSRYSDMVTRLDELVRTGTLRRPLELNSLGDGIEEVKTAYDRLPFYRAGGNTLLRMTHGFQKQQQKTPAGQIRKAIAIRKIDMEHEENVDEGGSNESL